MDAQNKVREVFSLACELAGKERLELLDNHCAHDPALRAEVEDLLEAYDRSDEILTALDDPLSDIATDLEGRTVSHYRIGSRLGAGGMGVVYEAMDETLRRPVALKFLPSGFGCDPVARRRFETEAQTAAAANHHNICTVYEIGETDTGRLFIAMALCEGETLKDILVRRALSVTEAIDIGIQIAEALARVHAKGIYHRDIKPSNIIVQDDGLVKIVDFGIAKLRGRDLTGTTDIIGTVGYMAPEQMTGQDSAQMSDIWSLGVVIYEMLAGSQPFEAPYPQAVTYRVLNDEPGPLEASNPDVGPRLAGVVERCLKKDPEERFESANDLLIALHRFRSTAAGVNLSSSEQASADLSVQPDTAGREYEEARRRVFLCYKHDEQRDVALARSLIDALAESHQIVGDYTTGIGQRWVQRLESDLAQSDAVVALLSGESARSELVVGQVELARRLADHPGRPVLLPILLGNEPLGYPLEAYLKDVNWIAWDERGELSELASSVATGVQEGSFRSAADRQPADMRGDTGSIPRPHPSAQPLSLEMPEGTMDPHSRFYIERPEDEVALAAIGRPGVTITIKGPRQMGKSSLLMRTMAEAAACGKHVVFLDFQLFDHHALSGGRTFFQQLCSWISDELDLDDRVEEVWQRPLGDSQLCTRYMAKHVLKQLDSPLLLAMDEVERVFDTDFRSDFFSMLRSWHNDRAIKPVWRSLDIALVTSTEPYQLIENLNQSPFNVGEVLELSDFTPDQLAELNSRHGTPLTDAQLIELASLVGGHPYLIRKALFMVASGRLAPQDLLDAAAHERGPFGDHLRNHLFRLHENEDLVRGMHEVLRSRSCTDESVFWRLRGAGLIRRENGLVVPRCTMYEEFFGDHLHG